MYADRLCVSLMAGNLALQRNSEGNPVVRFWDFGFSTIGHTGEAGLLVIC